MAMQYPDFSTDPSYGPTTVDPGKVLGSSWVWMSPLSQQQYCPKTLTWPSVLGVCMAFHGTGASAVRTDLGCSRATKSDMDREPPASPGLEEPG